MTAPRPEFGADDRYATEVRHWIDEGFAVPAEAPRREGPVYHVDDVCLCAHRFGEHVKLEPDMPVRCVRPACGCRRFRDSWTDADARFERAFDATDHDGEG